MKKEKQKNKFTKVEVDTLVKEIKNEYDGSMGKQKDRIFELKARLAETEKELDEYRKRERDIAKALTFATQKAVEIEEAARKKYTNEIEQLRVFHEKWRTYYNQLIKQYPIDSKISEIQEFDRQMSKVFSGEDELPKTTEQSYQREKARVSAVKKAKPAKSKAREDIAASVDKEDEFETTREDFVPPKNIVNFLEREETAATVESKAKKSDVGLNAIGGKTYNKPIPPSSSGFSIEEALNPTQDLADIMKELGLEFEGDL